MSPHPCLRGAGCRRLRIGDVRALREKVWPSVFTQLAADVGVVYQISAVRAEALFGLLRNRLQRHTVLILKYTTSGGAEWLRNRETPANLRKTGVVERPEDLLPELFYLWNDESQQGTRNRTAELPNGEF